MLFYVTMEICARFRKNNARGDVAKPKFSRNCDAFFDAALAYVFARVCALLSPTLRCSVECQ